MTLLKKSNVCKLIILANYLCNKVILKLTFSLNRANRLAKKVSVSHLEGTPTSKMPKRKFSDPDIHHLESVGLSPPVTPVAMNILPRSEDDSAIHTVSSGILSTSGDSKCLK